MKLTIDRDKARKLIEAGLSNIAVAEELGCRKNYIPDLKRELGFDVKGVRRGHGLRLRLPIAERERLDAKYASVPRLYVPEKKPAKPKVFLAEPLLPFTAPMQPAVNANTRVGSAVSLPVVDSEPARPLRFHELERKHCHWFIENPIRGRAHETMCCADPVLDGHAYCPRHHARAVDKRKTEASQDNLLFLNPWAKAARRAAE